MKGSERMGAGNARGGATRWQQPRIPPPSPSSFSPSGRPGVAVRCPRLCEESRAVGRTPRLRYRTPGRPRPGVLFVGGAVVQAHEVVACGTAGTGRRARSSRRHPRTHRCPHCMHARVRLPPGAEGAGWRGRWGRGRQRPTPRAARRGAGGRGRCGGTHGRRAGRPPLSGREAVAAIRAPTDARIWCTHGSAVAQAG